MKKIALMFVAALSLGFVACEDESTAIPQSNPQEATMTIEGLTVSYGADIAGETLDLAAAAEGLVNVIHTDTVANLPLNSELVYRMHIAASEDFANYSVIEVNADGTVAAAEWDNWFRANIGMAPTAKMNYVRFAAYVVKESSEVRLGGPEVYLAQKAINVTPIALDIKIEEAYYLLGDINGWDVKTAVKLNHAGGDVYDNPVFTLALDIPAETTSWWWKIIPQSTYETGDWVSADDASFGTAENGSPELSGVLVARTETEDCGAGCLTQGGQLLLTINMLERTYSFAEVIPSLYTPGNSNGWSPDASQILNTNDYVTYTGFAYLNGDFKFTSAADWDHINFGNGGSEGVLSTDPGAGNLSSGAEGLFWCTVDVAALTYKLSHVQTLGLIGDFNGWSSSVNLTPSADFLTWTGEATFTGEGSWKLRANDDWTDDWGGSVDGLEYKGGNIADPGAGTFDVTVSLATFPYTVTFSAK